ncbi:MAG TPA: SDR family NAD(P)-dependent oxidoreductase, partial [bacterium]|nr:SDR family NAD(P)-dependent oxidoreductase [bacterium]
MPTKRRKLPLGGTVALVTGASRGGGRGIALALGDAGATVYVTGRDRAALEKTARDVTARGGRGIAVRVDHRDANQIAALFRKIAKEQRGLDLLVNNVWGGYSEYDPSKFIAPFWEQPDRWEGMFVSGLRA